MRMQQLSKKKSLKVLGIMNGTSLDGIDFVLIHVSHKSSKKNIQCQFKGMASAAFSKALRDQLKKAVTHNMGVEELSHLHHELGREYVRALKKIKSRKKWSFDCIGIHGQTVFHAAPAATLQIGEASYLSAEFKVPVIADFRTADLAQGGQGAPIASLLHKVAFHHSQKSVALHNLGGISNLTLIQQKGKVEKAFDTGPANILIDLLVQKLSKGQKGFDKDGQWASQGIPKQEVVSKILKSYKFFSQKPPKSFGREEFGEDFLSEILDHIKKDRPEDQVATVTELTARSIAEAYTQFIKSQPEVIYLCGGGANNRYLHKRIQYHIPQSQVKTTQDLGWPVESIEGAAFALLAAYKVWDIPSNLPETTGAKKAVCLGKVVEAF